MGFLPKVRTRELVCDWEQLAPEDGSEPLMATVVDRLTIGEREDLVNPITVNGDTIAYLNSKPLRESIAPYVLAWNCQKVNRETGDLEPVPAPADGGPDVFLAVDVLVAVWLGHSLRTMHLPTPDAKKNDGLSAESSVPTSPATSSNSKGRRNPSRSRRTDSLTASGST